MKHYTAAYVMFQFKNFKKLEQLSVRWAYYNGMSKYEIIIKMIDLQLIIKYLFRKEVL